MESNLYCSCQCTNCLDNFHCYVVENGCRLAELDAYVDGMTAADIEDLVLEELKRGIK